MSKESSARATASSSSSRDVERSGDDARPTPPSTATNGPRRRVKLAAAIAIVIFATVSALIAGSRPACIDFYQFWVVGRAVGEQRTHDVYSDAERKRLGELAWNEAMIAQNSSATPSVPSKRILAAEERQVLETYSTPWMYTLFGCASSGDYDVDQTRFQVFSTLAFVLAIAALGRLLGYGALGISLWVFFFTSPWFKPFSDEVIAGNVNRLQIACLALFAWLASRERWKHAQALAGFVLGAAIAFKPNLAIVAVVLAIGWGITRQYAKLARQGAGIAAGALVAFAISCAFFGSARVWSDWIRTIPELLSQGASASGNYAFSRLVHDVAGFSASRSPVFELVVRMLPFELLALFAVALVRARARRSAVVREAETEIDRTFDRAAFDVLLVGLGATISVLTTDLVWLHYYMLCVPLALFTLRPERIGAASAGRWALRAIAFAGTALISLQLFIRMLDIPRPSAASPYVNIGALLLLCAALVDLALCARLPERAPSSAD